jgi:CPA2 family monovalent cation:H+ antiporter-2
METGLLLAELGAVIIGLSILGRLATKAGLSAIPLYLLTGLIFGRGGLFPLVTTEAFIEAGAQIGLVLLLLMIGLDYSARELLANMRASALAAQVNVALNFSPGFAAGLLLGWGVTGGLFLGGVTLVTSSGIMAKMIEDLGRLPNPETPLVLSLSVTEDLVMALYLPLLGALALGAGIIETTAVSIGGVLFVVLLLLAALRFEVGLSHMIFDRKDEILLLTIVGLALGIAGVAELLGFSGAAAALLVGILLSGPAAEQARPLLEPLRDLFAVVFFVFFGFVVDPATIPHVALPALLLAIVTGGTKFITGWFAARSAGLGSRARVRAGTALIPRGEFSVAVAGLGVLAGIDNDLAPLTAAYVMILAVMAPLVARVADHYTPKASGTRPSTPGPRYDRPPDSDTGQDQGGE